MALLTAAELRRVEARYPDGISSASVVSLFAEKGERFSEAPLRKYVQLGLLPRSNRVGTRGRHRGSTGIYPVAIVRLINDIKRALDEGATLEEIRVGRVGLVGELEVLQRASQEVFSRFDEAIGKYRERSRRVMLKRVLDKNRKALERDVRALGRLAMRIGDAGPTLGEI